MGESSASWRPVDPSSLGRRLVELVWAVPAPSGCLVDLAIAFGTVYATGWPALWIVPILFATLGVRAALKWASRQLDGLAAPTDDPTAVPARLTLSVGDLVYATDAGTVRLVDGWIVWTGIATDFSLPASRSEPTRLIWQGSDGLERTAEFRAFVLSDLRLKLYPGNIRPPEGVAVLPPERAPRPLNLSPAVGRAAMYVVAIAGAVAITINGVGNPWLCFTGWFLVDGVFGLARMPDRVRRWRAVRSPAPGTAR